MQTGPPLSPGGLRTYERPSLQKPRLAGPVLSLNDTVFITAVIRTPVKVAAARLTQLGRFSYHHSQRRKEVRIETFNTSSAATRQKNNKLELDAIHFVWLLKSNLI